MSSSSEEQENASPVYLKKTMNKSTIEPTGVYSTVNVRDIRARDSFADKKAANQYSTLVASDISDPFIRASFEGDSVLLLQLQYQMKKNWVEEDEIWSKSLLAFILAIQNSQIKTANFFIMGNEKIKRIIQKLNTVFDQAHGYERRSPNRENLQEGKKQKVKVINDSDEEESNENEKSRGQIIKLKNMELEDRAKNGDKEMQCSDSSTSSNHIKETKHKTEKESAKSKNQNTKKNTDAGSEMKGFQNSQQSPNDSVDSSDQILIKQHFNSFNDYSNMYDIEKLQHILVSDAALKFNTNILKIALNFVEDKVAAVIIANYPIQLDITTIEFAIQGQALSFLHSMFYHNMNEVHETIPSEDQTQEMKAVQDQIRYFTLEDLMGKVHSLFTFKEAEAILQKIMLWRIPTDENVLRFLIDLGHERVAVIFMDDFHHHSSWDFFEYCIFEEKQIFLKHALREQYFNLNYAYDQRLIEWALEEIKSGKNLLYPLNILLFNFNILDIECQRYILKFEILGRKIIESISFDQVEIIFMDRDFKDRSVLTIICESQIMSFIVINKLKFLINKIWDGTNSDMIDGNTSHYSRTKYLLYHQIKNIKGVPVSIRDIMGDNFKPNSEDYNFIFQNKFRQQSIFIIFLKDFLCATFIVCVFQYINYSYLTLFTQRTYIDLPDLQSQLDVLTQNLKTYNKFNFVGTILSVSYFFTFLNRLIYNSYSRRKIYGDIWMIFDLISGTINIAAFNIVGYSSAQKLINPDTKRFYDYYMIIALIISWLRFFSYFLVINIISKVTLTLFMMLKEAMNFLTVLGLYLCLMTTIFATLFRDCTTTDGQVYQNFWTTGRTLIDYFLANYPEVRDMANYNTSHSILVMIHITISNLFLLNFLIAILSTIYDIMIRNGDFYAIKYSYSFINKYMKSMEENNGYHVLVQYPPPLNFFLIPMIFVFPSRQKIKTVSKSISQFLFWFENFFFIIGFFLYLLAHNPLIILKIYFQILTKIDGKFYKILHFMIWTITGLFTCIVINVVDTGMLISILCAENSIQYDHSEDEKSKLLKLQYYIYRDIFRAMRQLNAIADSTSFLFHKRQNLQRMFTQRMTITEKMQNDFGDFKIDDLFIMRKELIIAVYEQIACQNPYILAFRRACYQFPIRKGSAAILNDLEVNMQEVKERDKEEPQMTPDLRVIIGKMVLSHNRDNLNELIEYMQEERNRVNNKIMQISDLEVKIIEKCLGKFTLQQKNQENTTINLTLVLKALPKILTKSSITQIDLFNFKKIQKILITFFNDDQDEMVNYFDNRMNRRLIQLKRSSLKNSMLIDKILGVAKNLFESSQMEEAMHKVATFHTINNPNTQQNPPPKIKNSIKIEPLTSALTQKSSQFKPTKKNTTVSFQLIDDLSSQQDSTNANGVDIMQHMGTIGEHNARQIEEVLMSDEPFEVMEFLMQEEKKALSRVIAYKQKQDQINRNSRSSNLIAPVDSSNQPTSASMGHQNLPQINLKSADSIKEEDKSKSRKSNVNLLPEVPVYDIVDKKKLQMKALAHLQTKLPLNMPTADQILNQIREKRRVTRKETNLSNDNEDINDISYDDDASDQQSGKPNIKKISSGKESSNKSRRKSFAKSVHEDSFKSDEDDSLEIQQ